ncbi:MAG: CAP domain-containing protein [Candidatus Doudnabacteria bacterium]|nr:CAP domain-containing protein [Candidatus Doudnabacteria bacterium]
MKLKQCLIACEENDYQPWITRASALVVFCVTVWSIRLLIPASFTFASPSIDAADVMERLNNERTQRFIPALITNSKLTFAATIKSNDMLKRSYFAHINPDGAYVWPTIEAAGYAPYLTLGENLAIDFFSASAVVEAWMNSATHRANVLNEKFQDQGLAAIFGNFEPGHDTIAIASLFGTLLKPQVAPAPSPSPASAATPKPTPAPTPTPVPLSAPVQIKPPPPPPPNPAPNPVPTITETKPPPSPIATPESQKEGVVGQNTLPASEETQFIKILRLIFGFFAIIYLFFLALDSIIVYRAKLKRTTMHSSTHALLFFLIALVNIFI